MSGFSFEVFGGKPIVGIDKYKKHKIMFEIQSELPKDEEFKNYYLGPFRISNFIDFKTEIIYGCKPIGMEKFILNINLVLGNKVVASHKIDWEVTDNTEFFVDVICLDSLIIKMLFAINYSLLKKNSLIRIHSYDPMKIQQFVIDQEQLKLISIDRYNAIFKFTKENQTYVFNLINDVTFKRLKNCFYNEMAVYLLLEHPNIIKMVGYSVYENMYGHIYECDDNTTLKDKDCDFQLDFNKIMAGICAGMNYLHANGIIHRDLKPSNILIGLNNEIKLSGFGICCRFEEEMESDFGTFGFMAPEVLSGNDYSYSIDVYSAGVVACFILDHDFSLNVFRNINEKKHIESLSFEIELILSAMLSENPNERPTFNELLILLHENTDKYVSRNDYFYYLRSDENIDLFHCLMFHVSNDNQRQIGDMSHLGQLLGDEYMSYFFDWIVLFGNFVAYDFGLKESTSMVERYLILDSNDYRFLLMPSPLKKHQLFDYCYYSKSDYEKGLELKNIDQEKALLHFKRAKRSGFANARYQIGRIYAILNDKRCLKYLNILALNGNKKACFYIAYYFYESELPNTSKIKIIYYFLRNFYNLINYNAILEAFDKAKNDKRLIKFIKATAKFLNVYENNEKKLYKLRHAYPDLFSTYDNEKSIELLPSRFRYPYLISEIETEPKKKSFYNESNISEKLEITSLDVFNANYVGHHGNQINETKKFKYKILEEEESAKEEEDTNLLIQESNDEQLIESDRPDSDDDFNEYKLTSLTAFEEFKKGMETIIQLDYDKGTTHLDKAAKYNNLYAIFFKHLFTFHGHCYQKERKQSLTKLIEVGKVLGYKYAFEVGIILLQGVYIDQDLKQGIEMINIADSTFYEIPKSIREEKYFLEYPSIYHDIIMKEYSSYYDDNGLTKEKMQIHLNPMYQAKEGYYLFDQGKIHASQGWISRAIYQDYLDAEFVYSIIWRNESCAHLFIGAKGGNNESQILLGLYLLYGINHEINIIDGIYWLEMAAYQEDATAWLILSAIYNFGFGNVPKDINKAAYYKEKYKNFKSDGNYEIVPLLKAEIDRIINDQRYYGNLLCFIDC